MNVDIGETTTARNNNGTKQTGLRERTNELMAFDALLGMLAITLLLFFLVGVTGYVLFGK